MNRAGLLAALAVAAVVGTVFALYPELDLRLAALFYDTGTRTWLANWHTPVPTFLREAARWVIALIAAPAFIALALKLILPRRKMLVPGRAVVLMIVALGLGPGLVANHILKDNTGRARPVTVTQFGGQDQFLPWWDPRGPCMGNCSFVAGEPSGAFWTFAPAALAPPPWRAAAYGAVVVFGAAVGVLRMMAGGHFFTDVVFAGVFTFLVIWFLYGLLYRWRPTRVTDESVEQAIERVATPVHDALVRLGARIRGAAPRN